MRKFTSRIMSVVNPQEGEFKREDSFKLARDIAWVVRTLWTGGVVVLLAGMWAASLAGDVKVNSERLDEKATKEQLETVTEILKRLETKLDAGDERQRGIQETITRLEQRVNEIDRRDERRRDTTEDSE